MTDLASLLSDLTEKLTVVEESISELSAIVEGLNEQTEAITRRVIALENDEYGPSSESWNNLLNELDALGLKLSNLHGGPQSDWFFFPSRMR